MEKISGVENMVPTSRERELLEEINILKKIIDNRNDVITRLCNEKIQRATTSQNNDLKLKSLKEENRRLKREVANLKKYKKECIKYSCYGYRVQ